MTARSEQHPPDAAAALAGLDAESIDLILKHAKLLHFGTEQYLFHQHAPQEAVYFVVSGRVRLERGIGQEPYHLATLGPGAMLGVRLLLGANTYATSARALSPVTALCLERAVLERLTAENPKLYQGLLRLSAQALSDRLAYADHVLMRQEPVFASGKQRTERDSLGERQVPAGAYYGIQTLRAIENFPISGVPIRNFPFLIEALACVKQAAALANQELGLLDRTRADAIVAASQAIREGLLHEHFVVDVIQGGAGTSTNMNANEVIANYGLELLGHARGEYQHLHPLNHVNMSQSTNDVYPTALNIALQFAISQLLDAMQGLATAFSAKGDEFADVIKMGRTQLQDAVPMTLGQEFQTYAVMLHEDMQRLYEASTLIREINMGATAIGTGLNTHPNYAPLVCEKLSEITGIPLTTSPNLIEATQDVGAFVQLSGVLKRVAVKLSKTCSDLRLLSSGPRTGLGEINLPPVQPGSTIMPGKVNPVIPEVVNQVAYEVIGHDVTVTLAAEAGQLQLNAMEPIIAYSLFSSLMHLRNACKTLEERCVRGITANREHLRHLVEHSIGLVTALNPYIGYDNSAAIAKEALETGKGVYELVLEKGLLTQEELENVLDPENMTRPNWLVMPHHEQE
ncbi:MAG: aspartate ammonia-lyase [Anaerolineae bacterium]|nr:aspartate ammonia-lyase [Anaerolineae bacterium]